MSHRDHCRTFNAARAIREVVHVNQTRERGKDNQFFHTEASHLENHIASWSLIYWPCYPWIIVKRAEALFFLAKRTQSFRPDLFGLALLNFCM